MKTILNTLFANVHGIPCRHNLDRDVRIIDHGGILVLRPESEEDAVNLDSPEWLEAFVRTVCDIDFEVNSLELDPYCDDVEDETDTAVRILRAE